MHSELWTDMIRCVSEKEDSSHSMEEGWREGTVWRWGQVKTVPSLENCRGIFRIAKNRQV